MRILVTGASGFIGQQVTGRLVHAGCQVTVTSHNPAHLSDAITWKKAVRVVSLDLNSCPDDVYIATGRPEVMFHLAWSGLPNFTGYHHVDQNLVQQFRFIQKMVQGGLKRLIVTGTCLEYGMQSGSLAESLTVNPSAVYGVVKDALRRLVFQLKTEYDFSILWMRLFYIFGHAQPAHALVPQLDAALARGDKVFRMSSGVQVRDFLPVEKAAEYLVKLGLYSEEQGIFNGCSGNPISVRKFVERYLSERGRSLELKLGEFPVPNYEPLEFWGDASKLMSALSRVRMP